MTAAGLPNPSASGPGTDEFLAGLLDGNLVSWDHPAGPPPRHADTREYRRILADARTRGGRDDSVLTGEGTVGGRRVAVVVGEFGFLAGTIGSVAASRIAAAVERATAERLPLLGVTASGGTRMQEGTPAFLRMAGIAAALAEHKRSGLPYLTYLRHPTTGGVLASWGSLGHITLAEPGALVGFLGPKVYAALNGGEPFPEGVQRSEHLHQYGLIDAIVPAHDLRALLIRILALIENPPATSPGPRTVDGPVGPFPDAWTTITATRDRARPGLRELLTHCADAVPLADAGRESVSHGAVLALARFGRTPCVLFGHDRAAHRHALPGPGALRLARRSIALARSLRLPLVTVIDTAGTELSPSAEEAGTAHEIAHCLADMASLEFPSVSVVLGQGAGGAALAVLPADRVVAARHSWITPLPPEGASAILHGNLDRAAEVAERQCVRAIDLLRMGVVDAIVDERPDAAAEKDPFLARMAVAIEQELLSAAARTPGERRARRRQRWNGSALS